MKKLIPSAVGLGLAILTQIPQQHSCVFAAESRSSDLEGVEFFEKKIRPLLSDNCYNCHSANTNAKGGLRVDDWNGLRSGGNKGAAVIPGDPDGSLLLKAVRHQPGVPSMPPDEKLTDEQIADLEKWIATGAAWPAPAIPKDLVGPRPEFDEQIASHWAWQSLWKGELPSVQSAQWPYSEIDSFVLARLEEKGLKPVSDAERLTLIRRVTFDLTGLPPKPEEIQTFLEDRSADAYPRLIDRLLASPAYGEHWGRHWLDVARYGESTGSSRNLPFPHAWRYRDYVIDSIQADKPYDQFIREQIAGDLLPSENPQQRDEQTIATGFLALGVKDVNQRFKVRFTMDNVDEQIDTVSRSFLALTVSCARCHDHKFDPITTAEYYSLAGIFESTDLCAGVRNKMGGSGLDYYDTSSLIVLAEQSQQSPGSDSEEKIAELKSKIETARKNFQRLRDNPEGAELAPNGRPKRAVARQRLNRLQAELTALTDPAANGNVAIGVRDSKTIADTPIRIRGEAELHGPVVPRGFLKAIQLSEPLTIPDNSSGRLELAQWLTHPDNPLPARVIVNRVWSHLFARGLVSTVDNFGATGDIPTHPELLDYLADDFVENGWSIKSLIRKIMLSRTYQLSSEPSEVALLRDPENKLLWRHSPRRLTAEEIRDAMLANAALLDHARPAGSPAKEMEVREIRNNGPEARALEKQVAQNRHRSVYLPLLRGLVPESLHVFDFAEQGMVTGSRDHTTVAPQALYLLNSPLVRRSSLTLAESLLASQDLTDEQRINKAYQVVLGRTPSAEEQERVLNYLTEITALPSTELLVVSHSFKTPDALPLTSPPNDTDTDVNTIAVAAPVNPDEADQTDAAIEEEFIEVNDARTAAWLSFCQALFGAAEFRYVR